MGIKTTIRKLEEAGKQWGKLEEAAVPLADPIMYFIPMVDSYTGSIHLDKFVTASGGLLHFNFENFEKGSIQ